jgi:hypothetical protein
MHTMSIGLPDYEDIGTYRTIQAVVETPHLVLVRRWFAVANGDLVLAIVRHTIARVNSALHGKWRGVVFAGRNGVHAACR